MPAGNRLELEGISAGIVEVIRFGEIPKEPMRWESRQLV